MVVALRGEHDVFSADAWALSMSTQKLGQCERSREAKCTVGVGRHCRRQGQVGTSRHAVEGMCVHTVRVA